MGSGESEQARAVHNCESRHLDEGRDLRTVCHWQRLTAPHLAALVAEAASRCNEARSLWAELLCSSWRIHIDTSAVQRASLLAYSRDVVVSTNGRDYCLMISHSMRPQLDRVIQLRTGAQGT